MNLIGGLILACAVNTAYSDNNHFDCFTGPVGGPHLYCGPSTTSKFTLEVDALPHLDPKLTIRSGSKTMAYPLPHSWVSGPCLWSTIWGPGGQAAAGIQVGIDPAGCTLERAYNDIVDLVSEKNGGDFQCSALSQVYGSSDSSFTCDVYGG